MWFAVKFKSMNRCRVLLAFHSGSGQTDEFGEEKQKPFDQNIYTDKYICYMETTTAM